VQLTQVNVFVSHSRLWQSVSTKQPLPLAHDGQTGPPQSTSVSWPFFTPSLQVVWRHCPPSQVLPAPQTLPHWPQLLGSVLRLVSQPSPEAPLQLPKPLAQVSPHWPLLQTGVALGALGQTLPHDPQFSGSRVGRLQLESDDEKQ
jgi:hypothetical protein